MRQLRSRATDPFRRLLRQEDGVALVLALAVTVIVGMTGSTLMFYATSNQQNADRSSFDTVAHHLAEGGINNAMSVLSKPTNNAICDPATTCTALLPNSLVTANVNTYDDGYVKWWGTFNLCLTNTAKMTKGKLYVKGSVDQQTNSNTIGTAALPLPEAHIAMGCKYKSQTGTLPHVPCKYGAATTNDNVWATLLDSNPQPISPPVVDWNGWYLNASPGPYFPCNAQVPGDPAIPTFKFDNPVAAMSDSDANKLSYRNDNQGIADLTPATSYTCITPVGQLSWNATTHVLTATGTIFIDGSAKIDNGITNLYHGSAVLYLSGSFLLKNSKLCPQSTTTSCTTSLWDNQADLLGIVANGNGSVAADNQVNAGNSIQLTSAYMAGAAYATNNIEIGTTSVFDGPLDAAAVNLGQSSTSTFNGFTFVPVGLPGETTTYAEPQAPTFSGG